ncbi:threonine synthase [Ferviditalea candida]|uniref:Threonine synthase n=1 Tax=Ferviditalea candida TaxID=3108399 RepID=A0ABU5ZIC7_9BACL|nr:threonine synthase [Paenibacillaceae bacterium T2]
MGDCWLKCNLCAKTAPLDTMKGKCECGGTLLVEYDLEKVKTTFTPENLQHRLHNMWRYHDLLPVRNEASRISLGEGCTPLLRMNAAEAHLPLKELWIKREDQNPTGSFKARGMSMAVSLLHERGISKAAVNSNGNAASALAAYAARAGIEAYVFVPMDCPPLIVEECMQYGAHTCLVDGLIHDAGRIVEEGKAEQHWFNVGTLKEPGRVEGKKTMGLELAEQFGWRLPDVIVYPTGGGSGVIGIWKAFRELREMGLIQGEVPRFVSVQEEGCKPIVDHFEELAAVRHGRVHSPAESEVTSKPTGMRVPSPPDPQLLVSILREMNGTAVAVTSEEIEDAAKRLGAWGISAAPEGAATWAGLIRLCDEGSIHSEDRVVLFNTAHALKYLQVSTPNPMHIVKDYPEWRTLIR